MEEEPASYCMTAAAFDLAAKQLALVVDEWHCIDNPHTAAEAATYLARVPLTRSQTNDTENSALQGNDEEEGEGEEEIWQDTDTIITSTKSAVSTTTWNFSIVYSPIWKVPILYFAVQNSSSGAPIVTSRIMEYLESTLDEPSAFSYEEHPITGNPACFLHPCRTGERMQLLSSSVVTPGARLWSWWVLMAPVVGLAVDPATYQRIWSHLSNQ